MDYDSVRTVGDFYEWAREALPHQCTAGQVKFAELRDRGWRQMDAAKEAGYGGESGKNLDVIASRLEHSERVIALRRHAAEFAEDEKAGVALPEETLERLSKILRGSSDREATTAARTLLNYYDHLHRGEPTATFTETLTNICEMDAKTEGPPLFTAKALIMAARDDSEETRQWVPPAKAVFDLVSGSPALAKMVKDNGGDPYIRSATTSPQASGASTAEGTGGTASRAAPDTH